MSKADEVVVPRDLLLFLTGEGSLHGLHFGDKMDGKPFWWRKYIHEALARRAVSAQEPVGWIEYGIDSKPVLGQRIVCEYKTGEVWAGKYGGAKHSFLRWLPLPPTGSGSGE